MQDVELILVQGTKSWVLGTVDADDEFRFTHVVTLPDQAHAGRARLMAPGTDARYDISVIDRSPNRMIAVVALIAAGCAVGIGLNRRRQRARRTV